MKLKILASGNFWREKMAKKIKILSGWSDPGGSTVALINLCNLFNERGYDCTFYGPHQWHSHYCKGEPLNACPINEEDERLIVHYLKFPHRPENSGRVILACHEKDIYPVADQSKFWDSVAYVSESQKKWQSERETSPAPTNTEGVVIPNVLSDLYPSQDIVIGTAGIIGSVDANKQTHLSIERAVKDGYKTILLYGNVTDQHYYNEYVEPLVKKHKVKMMGHEDNKQRMYDRITKVFHSSASETFNLVKAECLLTKTLYDGLDSSESGCELWTKTEILEAWKKLLNLS